MRYSIASEIYLKKKEIENDTYQSLEIKHDISLKPIFWLFMVAGLTKNAYHTTFTVP